MQQQTSQMTSTCTTTCTCLYMNYEPIEKQNALSENHKIDFASAAHPYS